MSLSSGLELLELLQHATTQTLRSSSIAAAEEDSDVDDAVTSEPRGMLAADPPPAPRSPSPACKTLGVAGGGGGDMGKQKVDDFTVTGAIRPVFVPSPCSEIEEVPPSPPPRSGRLLPTNAAAHGAAGGLAADAGRRLEALVEELHRKETALALLRSQLPPQQLGLGLERGELRQRRPEDEEAKRQQKEDGVEDIWAAMQRLELMAKRVHETLGDFQANVALRAALMGDERGLMPEAPRTFREDFMLAEGRMKKIRNTWFKKQIALAVTFASGLMLLIQFQTSIPPHSLGHVAGAFAGLWILGSIPFFRRLQVISRAMKGSSCHVARLIYICFSLYVVYALYLISPVGGTSTTGLP